MASSGDEDEENIFGTYLPEIKVLIKPKDVRAADQILKREQSVQLIAPGHKKQKRHGALGGGSSLLDALTEQHLRESQRKQTTEEEAAPVPCPTITNLPQSAREKGAFFFKLSELSVDRSVAPLYETTVLGSAKRIHRNGTGLSRQQVLLPKYSYKTDIHPTCEVINVELTEEWDLHVVSSIIKMRRTSSSNSPVLHFLVPELPDQLQIDELTAAASHERQSKLTDLEQLRASNLAAAEAAGVRTPAQIHKDNGGGDDDEDLDVTMHDLEDPDEPNRAVTPPPTKEYTADELERKVNHKASTSTDTHHSEKGSMKKESKIKLEPIKVLVDRLDEDRLIELDEYEMAQSQQVDAEQSVKTGGGVGKSDDDEKDADLDSDDSPLVQKRRAGPQSARKNPKKRAAARVVVSDSDDDDDLLLSKLPRVAAGSDKGKAKPETTTNQTDQPNKQQSKSPNKHKTHEKEQTQTKQTPEKGNEQMVDDCVGESVLTTNTSTSNADRVTTPNNHDTDDFTALAVNGPTPSPPSLIGELQNTQLLTNQDAEQHIHNQEHTPEQMLQDEQSVSCVSQAAHKKVVRLLSFNDYLRAVIRGCAGAKSTSDEVSLREFMLMLMPEPVRQLLSADHPLYTMFYEYDRVKLNPLRIRCSTIRGSRCALCRFDHHQVVSVHFVRTASAWVDKSSVVELEMCNTCALTTEKHFSEVHDALTLTDQLSAMCRVEMTNHKLKLLSVTDLENYLVSDTNWMIDLVEVVHHAVGRQTTQEGDIGDVGDGGADMNADAVEDKGVEGQVEHQLTGAQTQAQLGVVDTDMQHAL